MVKLSKKERVKIWDTFDGGDGAGWQLLIDTLKAKQEQKYLVDYIDMVVFAYYLNTINVEGADVYTSEEFDTYYNMKQFVLTIYNIWEVQ
jgi:hypothetical protein